MQNQGHEKAPFDSAVGIALLLRGGTQRNRDSVFGGDFFFYFRNAQASPGGPERLGVSFQTVK